VADLSEDDEDGGASGNTLAQLVYLRERLAQSANRISALTRVIQQGEDVLLHSILAQTEAGLKPSASTSRLDQ
jgi:hypothetical protein